MRKLHILLFSIVFVNLLCCFKAQAQEQLPKWKESYMDIHQIATGRGNAAFAILPDGTTLLIDVGDITGRVINHEIMPALPDASKLPGEWVSLYIRNFSKVLGREGKLDYAFLTHFHNDHMGSGTDKALPVEGRGYLLSGITEVAEYLAIDKLVDRNWPDYNYPSEKAVRNANYNFDNYLNFLDYQQAERGTGIERFEVGSDNQFTLKYYPEKYPDFTIRNVYSAGRIWTGEGNGNKDHFPPVETLEEKQYPNENICSSAIKISYGKFDYFTGGDITGTVYREEEPWLDVETAVAELVGPVEVAVHNHHAYSDAGNANFIRLLRPQAFVIPAWDFYHPQPETLQRTLDKELYPDDRYIFSTGLVEGNRERLGELSDQYSPTGHIVIRVYEGGDTFQIFVLDASSTDYEVIFKTGILESK